MKIFGNKININILHKGFLNLWLENPLRGTVWCLQIFPIRKFWIWGVKNTSLVDQFGLGPFFKFINFNSKKRGKNYVV